VAGENLMTYRPDNWVVIKFTKPDMTYYKVLGGWSSGYLTGSIWRLNSIIVKVTEGEDHYSFFGISGSCYQCNKDSYGLRMNNAHVYETLKAHYSDLATGLVELMPEDTDFLNLMWIRNAI
jgi:hypothetical protein